MFYADVFLLQNFLMDFIAIAGTNFFLKRYKRYRNLVLAACVSSVFGLVCLLMVRNYLLYCLITHFLINTAMVRIGFGRCKRREFIENWAVTYMVVILLGGILEWIGESKVPLQNVFLAVPAAVLLVYGILGYLMQRKSFHNHMLRVSISKDVRRMEVVAYWDSGNQLRDPYTGQGISIISHTKAQEFMDYSKDRIRLVPYRSLGRDTGLLAVIDVDEMILQDGIHRQRLKMAAIGIAGCGLLEDKEYDLILHASLL